MRKNIFELWRENGEKLPFRVRRVNWTMPDVFILVEEIVIEKWPYGIAYGKSMEINAKGEEVISDNQYHCRGKTKYINGEGKPAVKTGVIGCAGCYQWILFERNS